MFASFFTQAALGWLGRRALDWGGWLGTAALGGIGFYNQLSPSQQAVIGQVISGNWQEISLGALAPFAVLVFSQVLSFRATTKPQIVTADGEKVGTDNLPANKRVFVDEAAKVAVDKKKRSRKPSIVDKLFGR